MIFLLWMLIAILFIIGWMLWAPVLIEVDSRVPQVRFRWWSIGDAKMEYADGWWLSFRILFFRKRIKLTAIHKRKSAQPAARMPARPVHRKRPSLKKIGRLLRTFRVREWDCHLDTGDYILNAQLYALNFWPAFQHHLQVNFEDRNYLYLKITNRPWKLLFAWLR